MRDAWARQGTMCASVTWCGNHGMSRLQVCVDCIVPPMGNVMVTGLVPFFLLTTGAPSTRKWSVAPESEMA